LSYLKTSKNINIKYKLSTKSANILINDGTVTTQEIVEYIFLMHDLINREYHIENELVLGPAHCVQERFIPVLTEITRRFELHK
jgi:hypothetical protein